VYVNLMAELGYTFILPLARKLLTRGCRKEASLNITVTLVQVFGFFLFHCTRQTRNVYLTYISFNALV
jgi:hypothetical protein